jgi:hypothetical protein
LPASRPSTMSLLAPPPERSSQIAHERRRYGPSL